MLNSKPRIRKYLVYLLLGSAIICFILSIYYVTTFFSTKSFQSLNFPTFAAMYSYAAWRAELMTNFSSYMRFGVILASLGFVIRSASSRSIKVAILLNVGLLNFSFVVTAHGMDALYNLFPQIFYSFVSSGFDYFLSGLSATCPSCGYSISLITSQIIWDLYCLTTLLTIGILCFALYRKSSTSTFKPLTKSVQIMALSVLPLGLEIFVFDHAEFNLHVTTSQVGTALVWFTNADLLYTSAAVLLLTFALDLLSEKISPFLRSIEVNRRTIKRQRIRQK